MAEPWCADCGTRHDTDSDCPGELLATGAERHGWRVNVETGRGIEAYGVMVAEAGDLWRARVLTYPNVLWTIPGGLTTMKFVGRTPQQAERLAVRFVRAHCARRGYRLRGDLEPVDPGVFDSELDETKPKNGKPAPRTCRFLPIRFGVGVPSEQGGTGNLSETGLFIITEMPMTSGTSLQMVLEAAPTKIPLRGEVRWMRRTPRAGRSPGMGVQLLQPPGSYLEFLRAMS